MHPNPMMFLFGKHASALLVRPIPGLTLLDTERGELNFDVQGEPGITGNTARWRYRERDGGLAFDCAVERFPAFDVGIYRATVRNEGTAARELVFFQVRMDFDAAEADWSLTTCAGGFMMDLYPSTAFAIRRLHFLEDAYHAVMSDAGGQSSNAYLPILMVSRAAGGDRRGFWYGMEWSGEWYLSADLRRGQNRFRCDAGVPVRRLRLEPGEELAFPALHVGVFTGDDAAGTNHLRRYLWEKHQPDYLGQRPLPRVSYDHWFGLANPVNDAVLRPQVDRAAAIGVETWVHDAAWFGDFDKDVGDWDRASAAKYPNGLEALARYVRENGMDFGLWFEPERAKAGAWAVREHPELFWADPHGGDAFHLNLARRDAQDWVIELLSRWIERLDIRWSRYDYNITPGPYWHAADPTGKIQFAYVAGLYRVYEELRRRHPQWMIENCASGGRRIDLGTLGRSHTHWFSDHTVNPHVCRWMQLRAARFLPGNCTNSSVAIRKGAGDPSDIDVAVSSRMMGKLSFDGDIACLSPAATNRCRHWVDVYKKHRHLLVQDFHQLTPVPADLDQWDVASFGTPDGNEGLLGAFVVNTPADNWNVNLPTGSYTDLATGQQVARPTGRGLWHWKKT
jgi:alpha-galactosidase